MRMFFRGAVLALGVGIFSLPALTGGLAATFGGFHDNNLRNKIYLFKDALYWRWDLSSDTMDAGYPKRIADGWPGLPDHLDAAVYGGASQP